MHVPGHLPARAVSEPVAAGTGADAEAPAQNARPALTEEQELAVARRGEPQLLAAGAGSGKTSVLVERFVRAVREDGLGPANVLAITFTERAAGELRERVRARLLELGQREAARDTEMAFVGTFHGFCARLLRGHALLAGLDPDYTVLDEGVARGLRERAFAVAAADLQQALGAPAVDLLAAYGFDETRAMILGVHAELRSRGERVPRLPAVPEPDAGAGDDVAAAAAWRLLDALLGRYDERYAALKRARGAVDFDDLELEAAELLYAHPAVRAAWAERFGLVMVDEFQDTNRRQLAILSALERENLFTVGDELQAIYGFRHADVELFRARREELSARGASLSLTGNFRSRRAILDIVNAIFSVRLGAGYVPLIARRRDDEPAPDRVPPGAPRVELLLTGRSGWDADGELSALLGAGLPPAPPWRLAEARLLAQRVHELVLAGEAEPGEIAVLLRASGDIDVFERALQLRGLRTLAAAGGFWGRLQIRDLLSYLRTLANPLDETALYQALASPIAGVSSDGLALLATAARAPGRGAWATLGLLATPARAAGAGAAEADDRQADAALLLERLPAPDRAALTGFHAAVAAERRRVPERSLSQLLEGVLADGYAAHVLRMDWAERRMANVHKLLRLARRFEANEGRDLRSFLAYAEGLETAGLPEPDAPVDSADPDAVRLLTIHAAKGLEFPVVCVADLGRAANNRVPRLLVDGPRAGLQLADLDGGRARPCLEYEALSDERRRAQAEEEDRILYVAMTRARERLLLSGALELGGWPEQREATAIGWLAPTIAAALPAPLEEAPASSELTLPGGGRVVCRVSTPAAVGEVLRLDGAGSPGAAAERHGGTEALGPTSRERGADGVAADAAGVSAPRHAITSLSYTSLSELERCGYRYYLERVLGMPEERVAPSDAGEGGGFDARTRGTLVHRLMEDADLASTEPPTIEDVARHARELGARVGRAERAELVALLQGAFSSPAAARVRAALRLRREHPFAFSVGAGEPLVTGVIDLLAQEADGTTLVLDYKSDRLAPDADLEAIVERDYGAQRLLYALAVLRDGAPAVEVAHWFLERPVEWACARYRAGERPELERRLAMRVRQARELGFQVSPSPHRGLCQSCPGRAALCSWGEQETMREQPEPALRLPIAMPGQAAAEAPRPPGDGTPIRAPE
jgi:ATP-dependent exoDNAse (exonuclease V) beta subunit